MSSSPSDSPPTALNRLVRSLSGKNFVLPGKSSPLQGSPVVEEEALDAAPSVNARDAPEAEPTAKAGTSSPLDRIRARIRKAVSLQNQSIPQEHRDQLANLDVVADDDDDPPTFAERLRSLIDSLPSLTPRSSRMSPKTPPETEDDGRPVPPAGAVRIKDQQLIRKLFNPIIMNSERNNDSQSIWSILSSIRHDDGGGPSSEAGNDTDSTHSGGSYGFSDNSSVMMYSPLIPMKDDLVEIAESHLVTTGSTATLQLPVERPNSPSFNKEAIKWPWQKKSTPPTEPGDIPPIEHRVWIPSTTKLSCEVMWWGYRLYLPPPVLAILNDKQLEATKRAALITTALTWMFSNLPVAAFPLPMQPIILLLQKLVPYVGYIGTFISWSWGTVKSYDVGHGVILSATWILPVALLPSTWKPEMPDETAPSSGASPTPADSIPTPTPAPTEPSTSISPPSIPGSIEASVAPSTTLDAEPVSRAPGMSFNDNVDKAIQTQTPSDIGVNIALPSEASSLEKRNLWWKYLMNRDV